MTRAVRFEHYGGIEVLEVRDVDVPSPPPGEVTVDVRAAGINPGEMAIRQGYLESRFPATFPSGEGSDLAGVVVEVGPGVHALAVGDEVMGWTDRRQSHSQKLNVPVDHLILKPPALAWEVAGSLYVVGVTAYAAVRAVGAAAETGAKTEGSSDASTTEVLGEVADLVASGRITVPVSATCPLEDVRAAYTELGKRHTRGKVVLIP